MQRSERSLAVEIVRGAFAALWLPFHSILRRSTLSIGEKGQSVRRARFDHAKWTLDLLKHLEWRRFEELCLAYFNAVGFATSTSRTRDDGVLDISLRAEGAQSAGLLAHCRAWNPYPIGLKPLQDLRAAMSAAGVAEGVLVSCGRFTQGATEFAAKQGIDLIDGARLLGELAALAPEKALALLKLATKGDFLTPTCPACSIKMISRKSTGEGRAFWGCQNYPRCKQTFSSTANIPA